MWNTADAACIELPQTQTLLAVKRVIISHINLLDPAATTNFCHVSRRTGSTDSSKRAGAAARYANPGLLATSRTASEQSMSAASIIPSPAKPPLVPSTKVQPRPLPALHNFYGAQDIYL